MDDALLEVRVADVSTTGGAPEGGAQSSAGAGRTVARRSIDVDVLVRPAHLDRLFTVMHEHGWTTKYRFEDGSAFEHAATMAHPFLAPVDVHRHFPGIDSDPEAAFTRLWSDRHTVELAGTAVRCSVAHGPTPDPHPPRDARRPARPPGHPSELDGCRGGRSGCRSAARRRSRGGGRARGRDGPARRVLRGSRLRAVARPVDGREILGSDVGGEGEGGARPGAQRFGRPCTSSFPTRDAWRRRLGRPPTGREVTRAYWRRARRGGREVRLLAAGHDSPSPR